MYNGHVILEVCAMAIAVVIFMILICGFLLFIKLKFKRELEDIKDIPISTVRGAAIGFVRLKGRAAACDELLKSPFSGTPCVAYCYEIIGLDLESDAHRSALGIGDSSFRPFLLNDGTGKVMVLLKGSRFRFPLHFECLANGGRGMPARIEDFLHAYGIYAAAMTGKIAFREWVIKAGEVVYIYGNASGNEALQDHKQALIERVQALKNNPSEMKKVDSNNDGAISPEEWSNAVHALERELIEKELTETYSCGAGSLIIKDAIAVSPNWKIWNFFLRGPLSRFLHRMSTNVSYAVGVVLAVLFFVIIALAISGVSWGMMARFWGR